MRFRMKYETHELILRFNIGALVSANICCCCSRLISNEDGTPFKLENHNLQEKQSS